MSGPTDAQALAAAVGREMFANDHASRALGFVLEEIGPGYARMRMTVREDMVNGHSICHGGIIFTLADSTFAFACNSHNHVTVAQGATIEFLAPGRLGDVLTAEGCERHSSARTGGRMSAHDHLEHIEKASADELRHLQLERLKWTLRHAYDSVPHYRKKF